MKKKLSQLICKFKKPNNKPNRFKRNSGFTLNEILVTLLIVTTIGALAMPAYNTIIANARANRVTQCIAAAADAKTSYLFNPNTTDAQRTAWDAATEATRMTTLIAQGINVNGKVITSGTDLTAGTGQTSITLGASTAAPTIP